MWMLAAREPVGDTVYRIRHDVDLVLLEVSVTDPKGGFVSGLTGANFRIYEDGEEQQMRLFATEDMPASVGIVIDISGSMRSKRSEVVAAALAFARASHPRNEMFVINFNERVRMGLPAGILFTQNMQQLRSALNAHQTDGSTALYDAVAEGLEHLRKGRLERKVILLISDGGDNSSSHTLDEVIEMAQRSTATIYTIGLFDKHDNFSNPTVLKKLSEVTGGEAFLPQALKDVVKVGEQIATDIRNRYTLGYAPTNAEFDGKPRSIRVTVSKDNGEALNVRTRTSYIAVPRRPAAREDDTI